MRSLAGPPPSLPVQLAMLARSLTRSPPLTGEHSLMSTELPLARAQCATLRGVLSRLVAECAPGPIPAAAGEERLSASGSLEPSRTLAERAARVEDELLAEGARAPGPAPGQAGASPVAAPWTRERTWDVLLLAGDSAGLVDDVSPIGRGALEQGEREVVPPPAPGWEARQVLPPALIERVEAWERGERRGGARTTPLRRGAGAGGGGGGTPRRSGGARRSSAGKGRGGRTGG